ncbi:MAG: bis(5'-nucleosyl)-tetraphosphatase (symmetrical) YqeK [Atopobiaceae bacterium]|nr:bis(5'-nucleosyl)-tetraphosphatase (symmetrical) YqeK [Atopobiaceae bacterium]
MPYADDGTWECGAKKPHYTKHERKFIAQLEEDLREHMEAAKPARYRHSLSVAQTAEQIALMYGEDPLKARVSGILHDWDKVLSASEQVALAKELGIDMGVDLELVQPLLHGMTAARHLPQRYPDVTDDVWQAIERHTIGHAHMSALDMVIFVADGIEPIRRDVPAIHEVREMVDARDPLADVYWTSFYHGVSYVIDTERYLYPGTLDIYNELALARKANR